MVFVLCTYILKMLPALLCDVIGGQPILITLFWYEKNKIVGLWPYNQSNITTTAQTLLWQHGLYLLAAHHYFPLCTPWTEKGRGFRLSLVVNVEGLLAGRLALERYLWGTPKPTLDGWWYCTTRGVRLFFLQNNFVWTLGSADGNNFLSEMWAVFWKGVMWYN